MVQQICYSDPFSGKKEAICRLGGFEELYIKSVELFQKSYRDSYAVLAGLASQNRYEDALRFVHSIKGLAATLGMQNLRCCSESVELALEEGRYDDLPCLLKSYQNSLDQVVHSRVVQSCSCVGTGFSGLK